MNNNTYNNVSALASITEIQGKTISQTSSIYAVGITFFVADYDVEKNANAKINKSLFPHQEMIRTVTDKASTASHFPDTS